MKLYSADHAVTKLLQEGVIKQGDTLMDSSSGLYALALAMSCHKHGLKCHIIASKSVDGTMLAQLLALGATVDKIESSGSLKQDQDIRIQKIQQILSERSGVYWMKQYHDDIHYDGYAKIAEQIHSQLPSRKVNLVGAIGTGCSSAGIHLSLKQIGIDSTLVGVQPFGSISFGSEHIEDPKSIIAGIGSAIHFGNIRHELYKYIHWIDFEYACIATRELLSKYALFVGVSSGAAYLAAKWELQQDTNIPTIFISPDTGHRYVNAVFFDEQHQSTIISEPPRIIKNSSELLMPWCRMDWNHNYYTAA